MKLFLASHGLTVSLRNHYVSLFDKPIEECTLAFINNAKDIYPVVKGHISQTRLDLESTGIRIEDVDLREQNTESLKELLPKYDAIWLGGGNVFYLRYMLWKSGFDMVIGNELQRGMVFGGSSAGAIVAGPSLQYFEEVDVHNEAPEVIVEGLGLTHTILLPHWGNPEYQSGLEYVENHYRTSHFKTLRLHDGEVFIMNHDSEGKYE